MAALKMPLGKGSLHPRKSASVRKRCTSGAVYLELYIQKLDLKIHLVILYHRKLSMTKKEKSISNLMRSASHQ